MAMDFNPYAPAVNASDASAAEAPLPKPGAAAVDPTSSLVRLAFMAADAAGAEVAVTGLRAPVLFTMPFNKARVLL